MQELATNATNVFKDVFGSEPAYVGNAPGRVNLIGEHTDYNDGFVLPAAINFGTVVAATGRDDRTVSVVALDFDNERADFDLDTLADAEASSWRSYVRGVLLALMEQYPDIKGANLSVTGNVPQGAGLSSSASFEIALLKTMASLNELPLSGAEAAKMGQLAENKYAGCNCGIMDQMISACGAKNRALLLDCRSLETKYTSIPEGYSVLITNSNVKRGLVDSEYNTRREQCEAAAAAMGLSSLRDASMEQLLAAKDKMSEKEFQRAHHVLTENERTLTMFDALNAGDMATCSKMMAESHASMRDDFEITVRPIDYLVELLGSLIGDNGGVRMTGGGFGGCVVALVADNKVDEAKTLILENYEKETGIAPSIFVCSAEDGAFTQA
ncbi:galactokinase [Agaribacterium haliotis]|uniref:galactokinase n=1 Tax=Agaribacterium haliotis TaxID=2013869 RepID=UPI000BB54992|nr:galactokinase [Agaribacterium haliotis]